MAASTNSNSVWLVTGCSTGLGKAFAAHVHSAGHTIIATARNTTSLSYLPDGPKVLKLSLDVTSNDNITSAFDAALKQFGRIDIVINNAGYGSMGEIEGFPEEDARLQMETNFWGPMHITQAALKVFRDVNPAGEGGTIVQVSSIGGFLAYQGNGLYHASKFALEGLTKAIAKEVDPKWNIKLLILSPGAVKTDFATNLKFVPRLPAYADNPGSPLNQMLEWFKSPGLTDSWAVPEKCAAVVFDAVVGQKERPLPTRLNLGTEALPIMRADVNQYLKEMDEWEGETLSVASVEGAEITYGALK